MLFNTEEFINYGVHERSGNIVGRVSDIYFDDVSWKARYIVISTEGGMFNKEVLISPTVIERIDIKEKQLITSLSRQQIAASPIKDTQKTVSRQYENILTNYYGWPEYWIEPFPPRTGLFGFHYPAPNYGSLESTPIKQNNFKHADDPHLRSLKETIYYDVMALDGRLGHLKDAIFDTETWLFNYVVVDTRSLLPGKKVAVDIAWVTDLDWLTKQIAIGLRRNHIKNGPEFIAEAVTDEKYAQHLRSFYEMMVDKWLKHNEGLNHERERAQKRRFR